MIIYKLIVVGGAYIHHKFGESVRKRLGAVDKRYDFSTFLLWRFGVVERFS